MSRSVDSLPLLSACMQDFGPRVNFKKHTVQDGRPMPSWAGELLSRAAPEDFTAVELGVIEYDEARGSTMPGEQGLSGAVARREGGWIHRLGPIMMLDNACHVIRMGAPPLSSSRLLARMVCAQHTLTTHGCGVT